MHRAAPRRRWGRCPTSPAYRAFYERFFFARRSVEVGMGYVVEFDDGGAFCCVFAIEALSAAAVDASSNAEAELARRRPLLGTILMPARRQSRRSRRHPNRAFPAASHRFARREGLLLGRWHLPRSFSRMQTGMQAPRSRSAVERRHAKGTSRFRCAQGCRFVRELRRAHPQVRRVPAPKR